MARIVEVDFDLGLPTGGVGEELLNPTPRASGLHVSNIIRNLEASYGLGQGKDTRLVSELDQQEQRALGGYFEMGFLWELAFERFWAERQRIRRRNVIAQEPIEKDDIHLTPDGRDIGNAVGEEYKCTFRSSRRVANLEAEFWSWLVQIKAYAFAMGLTEYRLFPFFAGGNWRGSGPQARRFDLSFSKRELQENWDMLRKHRDRMLRK